MTEIIEITPNLTLEIHDGDTVADPTVHCPPILHLRNDNAGFVIIQPNEIRHLRDALVQAACVVTDIALGIEEPVTTATLNA